MEREKGREGRGGVHIGCSSAFWGDSSAGAWQLVHSADKLDYLVADYLAEVTMGILASVKARGGAKGGMGEGGYVAEFVDFVWKPLMKQILKRNIKVITNAGGLNPIACKEAIERVAREAGIETLKVAAISGDDILESVATWREEGKIQPLVVEGEAEELWPVDKMLLSSNAYVGAQPIVEALHHGAQVVITGRCVDSALVLGPLMFEYGWTPTQYDLLSGGSLAGHIIECGCQATGGNFTDWRESLKEKGWENVGFPIVECFRDGSFILSKAEETGGIVNVGTAAEQMLYEIHDPSSYILPDVICDWRGVLIHSIGNHKVKVSGAKGRQPTPFYKISSTSLGSYKLSGELLIGGIEAVEKAIAVGEAILKRASKMISMRGYPDVIASNIEVLGSEHLYGRHSKAKEAREVVLRLSVVHSDPKALSIFAREVAPAATSMAPGITGAGSGRPRPQPLLLHHSSLISKLLVPVTITVGSTFKETRIYDSPKESAPAISYPTPPVFQLPINENLVEVPLIKLCYGRSGDKGDVANIGLIARSPEYYPLICASLTEQVVANYFEHLAKGVVKRYEVPGIYGLNFVLTRALGGGGLASLNIDRQGKTYAQVLLSYPISVPLRWFQQSTQAKL